MSQTHISRRLKRKNVSNRIAGAIVTVPSVRRTLANLFDPCLTRNHVLRQSCRLFLKCLRYAKTHVFFSSTNLRAATLLLILYQPPTCCETLCLLSHAYPRSSTILQILSQMLMVCGRRRGRTRTHVRGRSIKLSVSNPRSVRPSPPCLTHTSVRQRSVIP